MNERLVSLDAFRGITIAGMILVNNPGSWSTVYAPLLHAPWHGWTPTDFIFPFFLFIVGVSMAFSLPRQQEKLSTAQLYQKIGRRTLILFGLGLFLAAFPFFKLDTLRIPGVLQRIAVVYLCASVIVLHTGVRGQVGWFAGLLLGYWAAMTLIAVPGYGAGDLSIEGNLAAFVDSNLLSGHMWKKTWDPEGILSTIPAIATTLSGVLTGHFLKSKNERATIAGWLFVSGWLAVLAGLFWAILFPLNKALWTSSYVVFTTGAALQFLAFCYFLIDVKGIKAWAKPAIVYGMNAIAVFVLSGVLARILIFTKVPSGSESISLKSWIYNNLFLSWADPINASLAFAFVNVLFWLAAMWFLYNRKIFIKI
ncbi:MAG: acyltransferase family protein [Calditrichia bacterium]